MDALSEIKAKKDYLHQMKADGVFVFEKIFSEENLVAIKTEIQRIRAIVMTKILAMERPLDTYSDIAERELGRLDYRCGFNADIFKHMAEPIIDIIKAFSPRIDFRHYWGVIPSLSGAGPTDMHRDVYPLLNTTEGVNLDLLDLSLPPYYFTVLIPLVQITKENGPTEFIKGSHLKPIVDESQAEIYAPLLSPGDIVVFDGRTLHRGSANNSSTERLIAYITFVANWYHDQTFTINNYLFPELSTKEI